MVFYNNFAPIASNAQPYQSLNNSYSYSYPYANYSPYSYSTSFDLSAYPNTLSIPVDWASDFNKDLSGLRVDPATLPIIPKDLLEGNKQPDSSGLHNLNTNGGFSYHQMNEEKSYTLGSPSVVPSNMFLNFGSELFTSPQNFQYILPNGRIGTVPHTLSLDTVDYSTDIDKTNQIIYEARKAKGENPVRDVLGRIYDPTKKTNLTDSQDFVDESLRGQIIDYYQFNLLDPKTGSLENRNFVNALYNHLLKNPNDNPLGDVFISDILGSHTALKSPLSQNNYHSLNEHQFNDINGITNSLNNQYNMSSTLPLGVNYPYNGTLPLDNVFGQNYTGKPVANQGKPADNPLAWPFNGSDYDDYSGTPYGEYLHILQYMKETIAETTKVKVSYTGLDSNSGRVPVFDPAAEAYRWMEKSPYYQDYVQKHIWGDHGGVHDVITPRGIKPQDSFGGGELFTGLSSDKLDVYKTPPYQPVTETDPRLK